MLLVEFFVKLQGFGWKISNRQLGRFRCRWDNIKFDLKRAEWGVAWISAAQDREK
jgi:hypothetical protein